MVATVVALVAPSAFGPPAPTPSQAATPESPPPAAPAASGEAATPSTPAAASEEPSDTPSESLGAEPAPPLPPPSPALTPAQEDAKGTNQPVVIGKGFHLFDRNYLLAGVNWTTPCQATAVEFEVSYVPWISDQLWWGGFWASGGRQFGKRMDEGCGYKLGQAGRPAAPPFTGWRAAIGAELGWRMFAVDVGYIKNTALGRSGDPSVPPTETYPRSNGFRFRGGLSVASELFTGNHARYRRDCCKSATSYSEKPEGTGPGDGGKACAAPASASQTLCECERTPAGIAVFFYYANELYFADPWWPAHGAWFRHPWDDGMLGISIKVGLGLPEMMRSK